MLRNVIDQGRSLDRVLADQERRVQSADIGALREIGYGGCRHYSYLDGIVSLRLVKPLRKKDRIIHFLLIVGLYQIMHMRVPDHAAVHQAVAALNATRQSWARGLVNGVLRGFLQSRGGVDPDPFGDQLMPAQRASLPHHMYEWVLASWPEDADTIFHAFNERPPLTLRVNRQKTNRDAYLALLADRSIVAEPTRDSPDGINLARPMHVEHIPCFATGWVSVQDESAQLCTGAMDLRPGLHVLDACAAPGGKTGALLEREPGIRLTAVDLPERMHSLQQNLARTGGDCILMGNGLEELACASGHRSWDRILLDVPCSGTGVIRRHPDIRHRRQVGDLERFSAQQQHLLELAWKLLTPQGMLLYVTCSILPQENDAVVERFLDQHPEAHCLSLTTIPGIRTRYGVQRLPGVHPGDGFFFCALTAL